MSGQPWTPGLESLLVLQLADTPRDESLDLELTAHVRPYRIPMGDVVRATYYYGSTGARIVLMIAGGRFCFWTREARAAGTQSLEERDVPGFQFNPKLSVQLAGPGSARLEVTRAQAAAEVVRRAEFQDTPQALLSDRCIDGRELEWQYTLHRGPKRIRDYLDETLALVARCLWHGRRPRQLRAQATLDDCSFFGPNRRALSDFKAFVLRLKLRRKGVPLPSAETVVIDVEY